MNIQNIKFQVCITMQTKYIYLSKNPNPNYGIEWSPIPLIMHSRHEPARLPVEQVLHLRSWTITSTSWLSSFQFQKMELCLMCGPLNQVTHIRWDQRRKLVCLRMFAEIVLCNHISNKKTCFVLNILGVFDTKSNIWTSSLFFKHIQQKSCAHCSFSPKFLMRPFVQHYIHISCRRYNSQCNFLQLPLDLMMDWGFRLCYLIF